MFHLRRFFPWILAPCLFGPFTPTRAGELAERTVSLEETLATGATFFLENLLGSVEVRGGGVAGKVLVEARVKAEAESLEAAHALAGTVSLERRQRPEGPWVHVSFPLDRYTAFYLPKADLGKREAAVGWMASLLRLGGGSTTYDGNAIRIERIGGAAALAVHVSVVLPSEARTSLELAAGPIDLKRLRGRIRALTRNGDVLAVQTYGDLDVKTEHGNIDLRDTKSGEIVAEAESGDVRLVDVDANAIKLRAAKGEVVLQAVRSDLLEATTREGDITLEDVEAQSLDLATGEGDLNITTNLNRTRKCRLSAGSGDMKLRFGTVTPFRLHSRLASGSVRSKLAATEVVRPSREEAVVRRGSGGAEIEVRIGRGDVSVLPK